jgi:RNase P protein component
LREAVRLVFDHIAEGVDMVFVIHTAAVAEVPFTDLQAVVQNLLKRARVWRETPPSAQTNDDQVA